MLRLRIRRRLGRSQVFLIPPCMAQQEGGGDLPRDLPPPLTEVRPNLRTDNASERDSRTNRSFTARQTMAQQSAERGILAEHQAGLRAADLCRKHGISSATFYISGRLPLCKRFEAVSDHGGC